MMPCHTRAFHKALGYLGIYIREGRLSNRNISYFAPYYAPFTVPYGRHNKLITANFYCGQQMTSKTFTLSSDLFPSSEPLANAFKEIQDISPQKGKWEITFWRKGIPPSKELEDTRQKRINRPSESELKDFVFPTNRTSRSDDLECTAKQFLDTTQGQTYCAWYSTHSTREISVHALTLAVALAGLAVLLGRQYLV